MSAFTRKLKNSGIERLVIKKLPLSIFVEYDCKNEKRKHILRGLKAGYIQWPRTYWQTVT